MSNVVPEFNAHLKADPFTAVPEVHLPWLMKVAGRFTRGPVRDCEAFSDACLGLMKAAEKYDPTKNVRFITFAVHCVRHEISSQFRTRTRFRRKPQDSEGIKFHSIGPDVSDVAQQERQPAVDQSLLDLLPEALRRLHKSERQVVELILKGMTLKEIGAEFGYSKQRAEQIKRKAFANLRIAFESLGVDEV